MHARLACTLAAVVAAVWLTSCATPVTHARWPFEIRGRLSDDDIRAIIALVRSHRGLMSKHIWRIETDTPTSVKVSLGFPERLGGELFFARKEHDRWVVTFVGVWSQ